MENMEIKNKKIIFCFPYWGAGGVPLLFIRLGNYLKNLGYDIAIIDYIDGFMSLNNDNNLEFIEYKDNGEIIIKDDSILILQSMTPWSIYPSLSIDKNVKLFFITTIPTNFYPLIPFMREKMSQGGIIANIIWNTFLREEHRKMKLFLKLGLVKKSLVFLDQDIVCNLKNSLKEEIRDPILLPLFSEDVNENKYLKKIQNKSNELIVGWVGRIADFKVHILNRVIEDLKNYSDRYNQKIKFIIVGMGSEEAQLLSYAKNNFSTERVSHIEAKYLEKQLLEFDLYFAMGTSALDGARLGVPTIRLDYSFKNVDSKYKYKFLFDVKGYSLGELIESSCYNDGIHTIDDIIKYIQVDVIKISVSCFEFYRESHSLKNSAVKFIDFLGKSNLLYSDLLSLNLTSSKLYNIWKSLR